MCNAHVTEMQRICNGTGTELQRSNARDSRLHRPITANVGPWQCRVDPRLRLIPQALPDVQRHKASGGWVAYGVTPKAGLSNFTPLRTA